MDVRLGEQEPPPTFPCPGLIQTYWLGLPLGCGTPSTHSAGPLQPSVPSRATLLPLTCESPAFLGHPYGSPDVACTCGRRWGPLLSAPPPQTWPSALHPCPPPGWERHQLHRAILASPSGPHYASNSSLVSSSPVLNITLPGPSLCLEPGLWAELPHACFLFQHLGTLPTVVPGLLVPASTAG